MSAPGSQARASGRSAGLPWGVVLYAVLALLLGATVLSHVQSHRREQRAAAARAAAGAAAAHEQQLIVASRNRAIDAAHRTYVELTVLRSALESVPDPATQQPAERRTEQAFWTTARAQSVQRLASVPQAYEADLGTRHPRWPGLDRAMREGLETVTATRDYLGNMFDRAPGAPAWRDRQRMRAVVVDRVRTLAKAMGEVCVTEPALDSEHASECVELLPDLPKPGQPGSA